MDVVQTGTGGNTRFEYIQIAGKTGTSEKAIGGRFSDRYFISTFAGFFPYENPQYVMAIIYDEPAFQFRFGGASAVPTFRKVVEEMLTLPNCNIVASIRMSNQELLTMPRLVGMRVQDARNTLNRMNIEFSAYNETGNSYVVHQFPQPGVKFASNNVVSIFLNTDTSGDEKPDELDRFFMPNLVGMSLREAINMSKALQLNLSISGSGHVVSQSIRVGEPISFQQRCIVVAR
jgi:hypothetical protein